MNIQYLGTAAYEGWPALFCKCEACEEARKAGGRNIRTRSQAIIDGKLLIDMPPDTYYHALTYNIDLSAIGHLLITHSHEDHFYPSDMIAKAEPYAYGGSAPSLQVYGNGAIVNMLEQALDGSGLDDVRKFITPVYLKPFVPVEIGEYVVTPLLADHMPQEECYIYIIEKDGKRLLYGHDTGVFPEATFEYIKGRRFDLVSLDCTFGPTLWEYGGHMGLPNNLAVKQRLEQIGSADGQTQFVINHFSHNSKMIHDQLVPYAEKYGIITAYDGMELSV